MKILSKLKDEKQSMDNTIELLQKELTNATDSLSHMVNEHRKEFEALRETHKEELSKEKQQVQQLKHDTDELMGKEMEME